MTAFASAKSTRTPTEDQKALLVYFALDIPETCKESSEKISEFIEYKKALNEFAKANRKATRKKSTKKDYEASGDFYRDSWEESNDVLFGEQF